MGTTPTYGWRYSDLGEDPDGQEAFQELADDVEATYQSTSLLSYTPVMTSGMPAYPYSDPTGIYTGRYVVRNGWCEVAVYIKFGASVNGGRSTLTVRLPVVPLASLTEQLAPSALYIPAASASTWSGMMILRGGNIEAQNWVTVASGEAKCWAMQSTDETGAANTGWPDIGGYPIQVNGVLTFHGRYRV